jgi:hypothetical protein
MIDYFPVSSSVVDVVVDEETLVMLVSSDVIHAVEIEEILDDRECFCESQQRGAVRPSVRPPV